MHQSISPVKSPPPREFFWEGKIHTPGQRNGEAALTTHPRVGQNKKLKLQQKGSKVLVSQIFDDILIPNGLVAFVSEAIFQKQYYYFFINLRKRYRMKQMRLLWKKTSVFPAVYSSLLKTLTKSRNALYIYVNFGKSLTWSKPRFPV